MENTTKEKIIEAALVSFAANGYKGTNLRDLAASMNLSKSALYKHFAGKEAIWNAVIDYMESYYTDRFGSAGKLHEIPENCDELFDLTMGMLDFTMHDEKVKLTRQLLLCEQFRDERAKKLASLHFLSGTRSMFTQIFEKMMQNGTLKNEDPGLLAFIYTSPITALIHQNDRGLEKEEDIMKQIADFVRQFIKTYGNEVKQ